MSHPYSLAIALASATAVHQLRRERHAAQERAEAERALCSEQGFPLFLAWGTILQGWAVAEQGQGEEGIAQIRQGLAAWRSTGAELIRSNFLALLAAEYGNVGQAKEGLTVLAEALAIVCHSGERNYQAELYRLKGELLLQQSQENCSEAEACFQQALAIARQQQAKSWELRAATSLAHLWQQQGKTTEARDLLAPVYEWFTEGFDTADLKDAKALLDVLEAVTKEGL